MKPFHDPSIETGNPVKSAENDPDAEFSQFTTVTSPTEPTFSSAAAVPNAIDNASN